jgi:hypothetical protein
VRTHHPSWRERLSLEIRKGSVQEGNPTLVVFEVSKPPIPSLLLVAKGHKKVTTPGAGPFMRHKGAECVVRRNRWSMGPSASSGAISGWGRGPWTYAPSSTGHAAAM